MDFKLLAKNATLWIFLLSTAMMFGGSIYQWLVCVPTWTDSLAEFHRAGLAPRFFWRSGVEEVALISGIAALILHWRTAKRTALLASLVLYVLGMAFTVIWFLPRLEIMGMFNGIIPNDPVLLAKTVKDWILADQIRFFGMVLPSFLFGLKAFSTPA